MEYDISTFVGIGAMIGAVASVPFQPRVRDYLDDNRSVPEGTSPRRHFLRTFHRFSLGVRMFAIGGAAVGAVAGALAWLIWSAGT